MSQLQMPGNRKNLSWMCSGMGVCGSQWLVSPRQTGGVLEVTPPLQLSPRFQGRAGAGTGGFPWHKLFITQAALPSQVFKPVWSLGERWFCSALGGPGWTVSPRKVACEGCRYHMLRDGCWASQHPVSPYPGSLCSCPWLRCRRNTGSGCSVGAAFRMPQ